MLSQKNTIRQQIIAQRKKFSEKEKNQADQIIRHKIFALFQQNIFKTICTYVSLPQEVDTHVIIKTLLQQHQTVIVPKVSVDNSMTFHHIQFWNQLQIGAFSLLEPNESCREVQLIDIDCFIIPGLAFDPHGHRLGWGKGFYDRLLKDSQVPKVALAYSFQILPLLPHESYDIVMTNIVTEKETIEIIK